MSEVFEMNDVPAEAHASWRRKRKVTESARMAADMTKAHAGLDAVIALLRVHFEALTERERHLLPKPREAFSRGARRLIQAVAHYPELALAARFDSQRVVELLDDVDRASMLMPKLDELSRLLADGKLLWLAQAFDSSRALYGMAKAGARSDGALSTLVDALGPAFAMPKRTRDEKQQKLEVKKEEPKN